MKIDSHIHFGLPGKTSDVIKALDITGCDYGNLVAQIDLRKVNETLDCLAVKYQSNGRVYCYGALDSTLYFDKDLMKDGMVEYVKNIMACGCDGIKMLEGKPTTRKEFPIPDFDSEYFDGLFTFLEENLIPIVWHVNDPEEFWDLSKAPEWAIKEGWTYDDSFVNNMDQYRQIDNLLKKHPNLVITFAHFYFLSENLEKLSYMFDNYPNVRIDITPGVELFTNLSKDIVDARSFFKKYSNRIVYGTDICVYEDRNGIGLDVVDSIDRYNLCYDFLTKDKYTLIGRPKSLLGKETLLLNGLKLDKDSVDNIMYKNFLSATGKMKEINLIEIDKELTRQKKRIIKLSEYLNKKLDYEYLDDVRKMFGL